MSRLTRNAQTTLALMIALTIVLIEVSTLVSTVTISHFYNKDDSLLATKALSIVDSGVEEAFFHLRTDADYTGGTITTSDGIATIVVQDLGGDQRGLTVSSSGPVLRTFTASIDLDPIVENPLKDFGIFGGDDIEVDGTNVLFRGDFRANDNLRIYGDAIVEGNAFLSGEGSSSNSRLRNNGLLRDDPTTLGEIEGHMFSRDDIFVEGSSRIDGDATSHKSVRLFSSGSVGGTITEDDPLEVEAVPIPQFDFDDAKAAAQSNGTYFTSPAAFLNYLNLSGGVISGGVHYIETNQTLTFSHGGVVDFTGTLVSESNIQIQSTSYTHVPDSTLPVLVSMKDISITDTNSCNCVANISGALFAFDDIRMDRNQHTGGGYSADIDGILWAGDNLILKNNIRLTYNEAIADTVTGFDFDLGVGGEASAYNVNIESWIIN